MEQDNQSYSLAKDAGKSMDVQWCKGLQAVFTAARIASNWLRLIKRHFLEHDKSTLLILWKPGQGSRSPGWPRPGTASGNDCYLPLRLVFLCVLLISMYCVVNSLTNTDEYRTELCRARMAIITNGYLWQSMKSSMEKPPISITWLRRVQRTVTWEPSNYESEWNKCTKQYTMTLPLLYSRLDGFCNVWPQYRWVMGDWASVTLDEITPLRARSTLRLHRSDPITRRVFDIPVSVLLHLLMHL